MIFLNENDVQKYNPPKFLKYIYFLNTLIKNMIFQCWWAIKTLVFNILKIETCVKWKRGNFWNGHNLFFPFCFPLLMEHVIQYDTLWPSKNYMLYTICTLDVFNPFNLIVGSKITLVTKSCHAHSKSYLLEFRITKRSNDCRNDTLQWTFV